jgi:gas vesicle protein
MKNEDPISFFKGVVFGVMAGAVAGILLAPKSGKETREDIKKFAEDFEEKAVDVYTDSKKILMKKIQDVKKAGELIDETKYKSLVRQVVNEVKRDSKVSEKVAEELGEQLKGDWIMVKKQLLK